MRANINADRFACDFVLLRNVFPLCQQRTCQYLLAAILKYHVVSGKVMAKQAITLDGKSVGTVEGRKINVAVRSGKVTINGATVIMADVKASNGVVHVIDKVLLPPS